MLPKEILETVIAINLEVDDDAKNNLDTNETKYRLTEKYSDFSMKYPVIFLKTLEGGLDMNQFSYMIEMASNVNDEKVSKHDASVKIGEKLVNEYVKPILGNNKKTSLKKKFL